MKHIGWWKGFEVGKECIWGQVIKGAEDGGGGGVDRERGKGEGVEDKLIVWFTCVFTIPSAKANRFSGYKQQWPCLLL